MLFKLAFLLLLTQYVSAFFDLTDIDDPLSLYWQSKGNLNHHEKLCQAKSSAGTIIYGICKHPSHCLLSGGQLHGHCGILSTCCTYERSCGRATKSKISYFTNGVETYNQLNCEYNVQLLNENVCQVRLDFDILQLSPPTFILNSNKCILDSLVISPNPYGIPELCGNNDNQHVYIHINQANEIKQVNLKMRLANRKDNAGLIAPIWQIKVTQLECPRHHTFLLGDGNDLIIDHKLLAPEGAIQYFMKNSGIIKSFGFDPVNLMNSYTSGERYSIAFKTSQSVCGVMFTPIYTRMRISKLMPPYSDTDCTDYLLVPELEFVQTSTDHTLVTKVCLSNTQEQFISKPPGPLLVNFMSAPSIEADPTPQVYAFNIKYDLLTSC